MLKVMFTPNHSERDLFIGVFENVLLRSAGVSMIIWLVCTFKCNGVKWGELYARQEEK